tara:strand:+ start:492 stop:941 length:450 start_codon:yes stop_codon:yes gene_type:complete
MISLDKVKLSIVVSEFNTTITESLRKAAESYFIEKGGQVGNIRVYKVPGAFEIPGTVSQIIKSDQADIIVALGCIIKGETPHFDFIATETSRALMKMIVEYDIPIGFGVLTTDDMKQAIDRSKNDNTNKGREAMDAALQVLEIYNKIKD